MVLRIMLVENVADPLTAAQRMVDRLAMGELTATAQRHESIVYPAGFWQDMTEAGIIAAFERGYFTSEECALLWRHLGRTDPPRSMLFPEELAKQIRAIRRVDQWTIG